MPRSIDGVIEWAKENPLYTYKDGTGRKKSWAGLCEAFVNNAGDFDQSFGSALLAGNSSGPLNGEWAKAPRGAIHYWAGVGGDGHVAFELGGGTLLMASSRTSNFGTALGTIHFTDYGLPLYRGWSMRHGTQTLAGSTSTAGNGSKELDLDMPLNDADVSKILIGEFDSGQTNPDGSPRWVSVKEALQAIFWFGNLDNSQNLATLAAANEGNRIGNVNYTIVSGIRDKPSSAFDMPKLAAELKAAGVTVDIDPAALVKALDASLADDFAAIPAAVREEIIAK